MDNNTLVMLLDAYGNLELDEHGNPKLQAVGMYTISEIKIVILLTELSTLLEGSLLICVTASAKVIWMEASMQTGVPTCQIC